MGSLGQNVEFDDGFEDYIVYKYPYIGIVFAIIYLIIVMKILPKYMEKREPYKLKTVIRLYNITQSILNAYVVVRLMEPGLWKAFWETYCSPDVREIHEFFKEALYTINVFVWLKVYDLVDTVFIILKKKQNQLSFLHLFHHTAIVSLVFINLADLEKLAMPYVMVNAFIHTVMYFYYMLSNMERFKKRLYPFKKKITQLQLLQFFTGLAWLIHTTYAGCYWQMRTKVAYYIVGIILTYQFVMFYYRTYVVRRKNKDEAEKQK